VTVFKVCKRCIRKVKVAYTRLPSVGFRSWFRFLAVSLQVTWVINPAVRLPLLSARPAVTPATLNRAATNFAAWWTEAQWVWTVCLRLLPNSFATAIWTRSLLRLSPPRYFEINIQYKPSYSDKSTHKEVDGKPVENAFAGHVRMYACMQARTDGRTGLKHNASAAHPVGGGGLKLGKYHFVVVFVW